MRLSAVLIAIVCVPAAAVAASATSADAMIIANAAAGCPMAAAFVNHDADANGKLSATEFAASHAGGAPLVPFADIMARFDADKDSEFSVDEYKTMYAAMTGGGQKKAKKKN